MQMFLNVKNQNKKIYSFYNTTLATGKEKVYLFWKARIKQKFKPVNFQMALFPQVSPSPCQGASVPGGILQ